MSKKRTKKDTSVKKEQKNRTVKRKNTQKVSSNTFIIWISVITVISLIVYSPSFTHETTNWDDDQYITNNPYLQDLSAKTLKKMFFSKERYFMGNYHPVSMLSLNIDYQIGGKDSDGKIKAWPFHFTAVMVHLFNTLLVFWLIYLLFSNFEIAVISSLLFGISTIHVESVSWVSERKDVLYTFFFLFSLVSYVKYIKSKSKKFYILSLFLFLLSLLSKGQAVSLAITIIAIDYLFNRKHLKIDVIIEKLPFLIFALLFGIDAILAQKSGNAIHDISDYELYKRIGIAGYGFSQYIIKLIAPLDLSAIYPYPDIIYRTIPTKYWLLMIPSLAIVLALFYYYKKNRQITFAIAFYTINIFLLLQLIPVGSAIMADRYAYIPSIGFFIFVALAYVNLKSRYPDSKKIIISIFVLYSIFISVMTFNRTLVWENSMTLWNDTVKKSPKAVVAWNNRGSTKDKEKDHVGAIKDFTTAIKYKPDYKHAFYNRGTAKKDLGIAKRDTMYFTDAIVDFSEAIRIDSSFSEAYHNRGITRENLADYQKFKDQFIKLLNLSIIDYDKAIELNNKKVKLNLKIKDRETVYISRGVAKGKIGELKEAIINFDLAIGINPKSASAFSNRGLANDNSGNYENAILDYNKAIKLDPKFITAYVNRGIVYRRLKKLNEAIANFDAAIALDEKKPEAYYFKGLSLLTAGKKDEGCQNLYLALKLGYSLAQSEITKFCK